jgi:hypothetical protein
MPSLPYVPVLAASIIAAFIGMGSYLFQPSVPQEATLSLSPTSATRTAGEVVTVDVTVSSPLPVNAFGGFIRFDPTLLAVEKIDYNNSIADLWAEAPWYENGDGTIQFAGGTTRAGGFTGDGTLLTITFRTRGAGAGSVEIERGQVLQHDGLGTEVPLATPIDALFTIETAPPTTNPRTAVAVASQNRTLDLSGDGDQSLTDVSILLQYLLTGDERGDVNGDGVVSLADMSIVLETI